MATNIEGRLQKLEAALTPTDPMERQVIIVTWVNPDRTIDPVSGYSDGNGHRLERAPNEELGAFEDRAKAWVRTKHPPEHPSSICVLWSILA